MTAEAELDRTEAKLEPARARLQLGIALRQARPRRLALSGVESLTPGQLRVAKMAAEGMSNREIAEALFVTRRTVETHLTQVYGKLEIGSREELPDALERSRGPRPG